MAATDCRLPSIGWGKAFDGWVPVGRGRLRDVSTAEDERVEAVEIVRHRIGRSATRGSFAGIALLLRYADGSQHMEAADDLTGELVALELLAAIDGR